MAIKTIRLKFRGPVHFGRGRLSDSGYTCDAATIFSALFIEALHMGIADELLDAARCGDIAISDAFPYIGSSLYLPKPMLAVNTFDTKSGAQGKREEKASSRERKAHKKLAYIPAARYISYLDGTFDAISELDSFILGDASLQTKVNLTHEDGPDAKPYFVGSYTFSPGAGLYFLVNGTYDLAPLLEQLSYSGIGGKRTSGYGQFDYSLVNENPLALTKKRPAQKTPTKVGRSKRAKRRATQRAQQSLLQTDPRYILLSTSLPQPNELTDELLDGARYRLVRRGGFVQSCDQGASPNKKRDMYLFASGSTFAHKFSGDVYDVNSAHGSHPVWRYAKAMWMEV